MCRRIAEARAHAPAAVLRHSGSPAGTREGSGCSSGTCGGSAYSTWKHFARKAEPAAASLSLLGLGSGSRPARHPPALRSAAAACPHALLRGDAPDRVDVTHADIDKLGEPQGPIRPGHDPVRQADARVGEVGDLPGGGDAPDRVVAVVSEPQGPIGPGRDPRWAADARVAVDLHLPGGGDAPDRALVRGEKIGE